MTTPAAIPISVPVPTPFDGLPSELPPVPDGEVELLVPLVAAPLLAVNTPPVVVAVVDVGELAKSLMTEGIPISITRFGFEQQSIPFDAQQYFVSPQETSCSHDEGFAVAPESAFEGSKCQSCHLQLLQKEVQLLDFHV